MNAEAEKFHMVRDITCQCIYIYYYAGEGHSAPKIQEAFDENKLQLLQDDESSPLFAMASFEELGLYE